MALFRVDGRGSARVPLRDLGAADTARPATLRARIRPAVGAHRGHRRVIWSETTGEGPTPTHLGPIEPVSSRAGRSYPAAAVHASPGCRGASAFLSHCHLGNIRTPSPSG